MKRKSMQEFHMLALTIAASYAAFNLSSIHGRIIFGILAIWGIFQAGWWLQETISYKLKIRKIDINDVVLVDEFMCPKCHTKYNVQKKCCKVTTKYTGTKHATRCEAEANNEKWYLMTPGQKESWTFNGKTI